MSDFATLSGANFTATSHDHAKGPTLPSNNKPASSDLPYNIVVTGAGKGLGRSISLSYAKAGATGLCISSRTQSDLDSLGEELLKINPKLNLVSTICDTSKESDVKALADECSKRFDGAVDVVIANAGIISKYIDDDGHSTATQAGEGESQRRLPVGIIEDHDFTRVTNINYLGSFYTAQYFTPLLLKSSGGRKVFIVITSLAAHNTASSFVPTAYNVSKLANCRMVEHMANDHGEEGLLAYAVHPGEVVTPQTLRHSRKKGDMWEQRKSLESFPLRQVLCYFSSQLSWLPFFFSKKLA